MNDMRYDSHSDNLFILNYIDNPLMTAQSYVFQIGAPTALAGPCRVKYRPYPKVLHALDNCTPTGFIASGTDANSILNVWKGYPHNPGNCEIENDINFSATMPPLDIKLQRHHLSFLPLSADPYSPMGTSSDVTNIICQ